MTKVDIAVTIAPEKNITNETLQQLKNNSASFEIIELRIDQWLEYDATLLRQVIEAINDLNINKQLLVTYRTESQGGEGILSTDNYMQLLSDIMVLDGVDLLDIEFDKGKDKEALKKLINEAEAQGVKIVLSYHDFKQTPSIEELKHLYFKMHQLSPSYIKVAVMPHDKIDVLRLLEVVSETADTVPENVIGISMSKLGIVSRTAQGVFGGTISYGCIDTPKAPGQIHVETLRTQLNLYE
ncbi:type I 3-dehydroquinate dehydratase [Staphylococcus gallinarum]|uniref:3-dehydroquinate dehydratase n=1 Tax=Staphylococcus gallinarum TaxID=1293 RepID=A0A3A0VM42_STAGA|nr:type I 3-dehydroquinate dehydratase [Staphylococcus gallinarum]RIP35837.1 type I 3-dehydroquinate dehydratase [Staphylococcus gallinarum]